MKFEDGEHIVEENLKQLDARHEMYLIGEDFAAAEVLMKELCSDEWDVLVAALDASKTQAHEEINEVQKHAQATLKALCLGDFNTGTVHQITMEVNQILGKAHQIANEACDRLES